MDLKQIKELMAAMGRAGVKRLKLKNDEFEIEIEKAEEKTSSISSMPEQRDDYIMHNTGVESRVNRPTGIRHDIPPSIQPLHSHSESKKEVVEGIYITSPMVGTFYASPGPDDPTFIKVGDKIDKDTIVCIIEAMKVMNEVKAGMSGTVAEVLIESGHPVEFGTKLFRIT